MANLIFEAFAPKPLFGYSRTVMLRWLSLLAFLLVCHGAPSLSTTARKRKTQVKKPSSTSHAHDTKTLLEREMKEGTLPPGTR